MQRAFNKELISFQQMALGQLDIQKQDNEVKPLPHTNTKNTAQNGL